MSQIVIAALFTQAGGAPAAGLALADIDLYLFSRDKATGVVAAIWSPVNPTEEVGGGLYTRAYNAADENTYSYYAYAQYLGIAALDSDYALMASPSVPSCCAHSPGAVEFTYTVTNSVTGLPEEGVEVWAALDSAPSVVVWSGDTDAFGVARDDFGSKPWLDPGTYRFYKQKAGFTDVDTPYDTEIVS